MSGQGRETARGRPSFTHTTCTTCCFSITPCIVPIVKVKWLQRGCTCCWPAQLCSFLELFLCFCTVGIVFINQQKKKMDDEEARPFSVKPVKATSPQPLAPLIVTQAAPRGAAAPSTTYCFSTDLWA